MKGTLLVLAALLALAGAAQAHVAASVSGDQACLDGACQTLPAALPLHVSCEADPEGPAAACSAATDTLSLPG